MLLTVSLLLIATAFSASSASSDLLPDEANTISVYAAASRSVVSVTNTAEIFSDYAFSASEERQQSATGIIWDTLGHIVTNHHVVEAAKSISVKIGDTIVEGELVGSESIKDLAVIKIAVPDSLLTPILLGSQKDIVVGKKAIAIGNPFGFDNSVTTGIISAKGRRLESIRGRTIRDLIQCDAAINPGNSGGPLLDSGGRLLGINSSIYTNMGGGNIGIGFAIPVHTVRNTVMQIIQYGKVKRVGLGITTLSDSDAKQKVKRGVVILNTPDYGAAYKAGLRGISKNDSGNITLGDVIVGINDSRVENNDDLFSCLESCTPNQTVQVVVLREGRKVNIPVKLKALE
ncbi:MAG: S1C family serine protease [Chitinispirillaceae bacterium]